jgi:type IV fimbrial biogenesis protein FimT
MHSRGFTLIELLVVMTISAILIAAAVPSFVWFMATSRTSDSTNTLLAGLQLARSEAIRRNMVVVVCRSLNPFEPAPFLPAIQCTNDPGAFAADDWGSGWIVFAKTGAADPENPVTTDFEAGDTVLYRQGPVGGGSTRIVIGSNIGAGPVAYRGDGSRRNGNGTFTIDYRVPLDPVSNAARCVVVNWVGTPRSARAPAGACPP